MPHHACCLLNLLLSQPLLLWLLSGTSFFQLYDGSLEASVPASTTGGRQHSSITAARVHAGDHLQACSGDF